MGTELLTCLDYMADAGRCAKRIIKRFPENFRRSIKNYKPSQELLDKGDNVTFKDVVKDIKGHFKYKLEPAKENLKDLGQMAGDLVNSLFCIPFMGPNTLDNMNRNLKGEGILA